MKLRCFFILLFFELFIDSKLDNIIEKYCISKKKKK